MRLSGSPDSQKVIIFLTNSESENIFRSKRWPHQDPHSDRCGGPGEAINVQARQSCDLAYPTDVSKTFTGLLAIPLSSFLATSLFFF